MPGPIAQICMRHYEPIEFKISFSGNSSDVRGGRFLANWDTDLLYVRAESAIRLTRTLRDVPWAPQIRCLAVRVPSLHVEDMLVLDEFGFCGANTYKEAYEAAKSENLKAARLLREHINMLDAAGALWSRGLSWTLERLSREVKVVTVADRRANMRGLGWHET
ncbi:hypothetical protein DL764_008263 [Monosporascus ibericus]|uniref:Uncharacterized protein n=1 Tax=Monosporascus ibericus TaxID=155417 RepID=A0A4Q4T077_9PEZI|nr:hypothetical protein DL764_008263 [Monosporascus ibericus]